MEEYRKMRPNQTLIFISKVPLRGVPAIALDLSLVIQIHQKLGRDLGSILEGLGLDF